MIKILDSIYLVEAIGFVNAFAVGRPQSFALIDTGIPDTAKKVIEELETAGFALKNLTEIILTHGHPDHTGGLKEILDQSDARLTAHSGDISVIESELKNAGCRKTTVDRVLENGDTIDLIGGLEVINLTGHTPGSVALYQREKRIMFLGDVIKDVEGEGLCIGKPEQYNADTGQTMKDGRKLLGYDIETALLSHGAPILKENIQRLYDLDK